MIRWAEENRTAWIHEHLVRFFTTWSREPIIIGSGQAP
jgi:hypothetical protein